MFIWNIFKRYDSMLLSKLKFCGQILKIVWTNCKKSKISVQNFSMLQLHCMFSYNSHKYFSGKICICRHILDYLGSNQIIVYSVTHRCSKFTLEQLIIEKIISSWSKAASFLPRFQIMSECQELSLANKQTSASGDAMV